MKETNELPTHNVKMSFHIFDENVVVEARLPVRFPTCDDNTSTLSFLHENTKNLFSSFNPIKVNGGVFDKVEKNVIFNITLYYAVSEIAYENSDEIINFAKSNGMVIIDYR